MSKNWRPPDWEEIKTKSIKTLVTNKDKAYPPIYTQGEIFEAGADAIEPLARKDERDRILRFLKGLAKTTPKASLLATIDLIEATKPPNEEAD